MADPIQRQDAPTQEEEHPKPRECLSARCIKSFAGFNLVSCSTHHLTRTTAARKILLRRHFIFQWSGTIAMDLAPLKRRDSRAAAID